MSKKANSKRGRSSNQEDANLGSQKKHEDEVQHTGVMISAPSAHGSIYSNKPPLSPAKPRQLTIESALGSRSPSRQAATGAASATHRGTKSNRSKLKDLDLDVDIKKHFNINLDKIEEERDELTSASMRKEKIAEPLDQER